MSPKVSIIIPMFNNENDMERCIKSIISQTLNDIEIIIVDDGSTDNSIKIAKEYELKDHRIKLIQQKNSGVSTARNTGIYHSTGEYIGFVDSDDWIDYNMYESMYKIAIQSN